MRSILDTTSQPGIGNDVAAWDKVYEKLYPNVLMYPFLATFGNDCLSVQVLAASDADAEEERVASDSISRSSSQVSYCMMWEGRVTGELLCDGGGEGHR